MLKIYSEELINKYSEINESFQNSQADNFPAKEALATMQQNFRKDDSGSFAKIDGRIIASACDVWPLFIKIENSGLREFLNKKAQEIFYELLIAGKEIYWPQKNSYHISVALLQDLRPCDMCDEKLLNTRLGNQQINEICGQIKPIIENFPAFRINLYGISVSQNGSITAIFIDDGSYFSLQNKIGEKLNSFSFIPERKYKKDIIHITLGRILEPVEEELFLNVKDLVKKYYNLLDLNWQAEVREIKLAHEIQWMHEKLEIGSEIKFLLK